MRHDRFPPHLVLASLALALGAAGVRAQEAVPLAEVERETRARIGAGAANVGWICAPLPDGGVGCSEADATAVRFGDGRHGARPPVRVAPDDPEAAHVQPSQRRVIVMAPQAGPDDAELARVGSALVVDPASEAPLRRWSELVESEIRAGRDPARLVPRILEEALQTVGDDAQLANVELQAALQRQQQTLQTLSNMMKSLHDTAMAVIRKIGG